MPTPRRATFGGMRRRSFLGETRANGISSRTRAVKKTPSSRASEASAATPERSRPMVLRLAGAASLPKNSVTPSEQSERGSRVRSCSAAPVRGGMWESAATLNPIATPTSGRLAMTAKVKQRAERSGTVSLYRLTGPSEQRPPRRAASAGDKDIWFIRAVRYGFPRAVRPDRRSCFQITWSTS